jgi:hypothetical protein
MVQGITNMFKTEALINRNPDVKIRAIDALEVMARGRYLPSNVKVIKAALSYIASEGDEPSKKAAKGSLCRLAR